MRIRVNFVLVLAALALSGCSLFPTDRYRLASYENDHAFLQAEGQRVCGRPVPPKGCDAAKTALNVMKAHIDGAAAVSKTGHLTLQLKALSNDKAEVLKSGIYR